MTTPVGSPVSTYENVIKAWSSALEIIENIVSGTAHVIRDGAVLVALSAWHMYPDMIVFGASTGNKEIKFDDPLIRIGGVLSLGITDVGDRANKGVYWSLSLAHHKYYGGPIKKTAHLEEDGRRITFEDLQLVVIGAILANWAVPVPETDEALQYLLALVTAVEIDPDSKIDRWIPMVTASIRSYYQNSERGRLLLGLGRRRRCMIHEDFTLSSYLNPGSKDRHFRPFYGTTYVSDALNMLKGTEERVSLLRRLAERVDGLRDNECVIAFFQDSTPQHTTVFPQHTNESKRRRITTRSVSSRQSSSAGNSDFSHDGYIVKLRGLKFEFLFGDIQCAAVYVLKEGLIPVSSKLKPAFVTRQDCRWCLENGLVDLEELKGKMTVPKDPVFSVWIMMVRASETYSDLSREGATITTHVLKRPLRLDIMGQQVVTDNKKNVSETDWEVRIFEGLNAFRLIAYFETGVDIGAQKLGENASNSIIGLSVGDSIYVPKRVSSTPGLLCRLLIHHRFCLIQLPSTLASNTRGCLEILTALG